MLLLLLLLKMILHRHPFLPSYYCMLLVLDIIGFGLLASQTSSTVDNGDGDDDVASTLL